MGKKYQWIAFYEVLGRLSDHHLVQPWGDETPVPYRGAEQLVWRDIDPTVLARKPAEPRLPAVGQLPWFAPVAAAFPDAVIDDYPTDMAGAPDPMDLLTVTDQDGTAWLRLVGNDTWKQPLPVEVIAQRVPRLATWMHLQAYLVPTAQIDALAAWALDKDWFGRWMPDFADTHNVLFGSYPDGYGWDSSAGVPDLWRTQRHGPPPADLRLAATWYGGTGTTRDASADQQTHGLLPTRLLLDSLDLSKGRDFRWRDSTGLAIFDPSVVTGGSNLLLLRRDLAGRLHNEGTTLFWTMLASRELHLPDPWNPGDQYRWVTASAAYSFDGDQVGKIYSTAKRCRPGPHTDYEVDWSPGL